MTDPIEALAREVDRVDAFLHGLSAGDWELATRCPPLTVRELATHAARGAVRLLGMAEGEAIADEPQKDAVTYFQYDPIVTGIGVVRRAQEESAGELGMGMPDSWTRSWAKAIPATRARLQENPVVQGPGETLRLSEYVRTRCVEVTIHAMDLRDALGLAPDPTPEGLDACGDVLRGLLGADLRPLGMGELRFALVGTGREKLTDSERDMLGPLADLFPVLQ